MVKDNYIEMYPTDIEGKSVISERIIRTTIINKFNNTYQITIEMNPVGVKPNQYIDLQKIMMDILNLKFLTR